MKYLKFSSLKNTNIINKLGIAKLIKRLYMSLTMMIFEEYNVEIKYDIEVIKTNIIKYFIFIFAYSSTDKFNILLKTNFG